MLSTNNSNARPTQQTNMKTFQDDKPLLHIVLILLGVIVGSFIGTISAVLLLGTLLSWR